MKIKDLPQGMVIWTKDSEILGITGITVDDEYLDYEVIKLPGNPVDYQLVEDVDLDFIEDIVDGHFIC